MNLTKTISYVLLIVSLSLAYYLYHSVHSTIKFRESIHATEAKIIKKLEIIREGEKIYLEQYGRYTSNWDSLITFIQAGVVPITVRTEKVIPLTYGADSIYVRVDTIGSVSVREKIFKKTYTVNAADDGVFMGYEAKLGDQVLKGAKSYKLKAGDRVNEYTFLENGKINSMARLQTGSSVTKGQPLITFWEYAFDPNTDVSELNIVPGSQKAFDIYADKIERNNVKVPVIEVKDPAPINPERSEGNEAKNRKPLRFGSRSDVSLGGNWE